MIILAKRAALFADVIAVKTDHQHRAVKRGAVPLRHDDTGVTPVLECLLNDLDHYGGAGLLARHADTACASGDTSARRILACVSSSTRIIFCVSSFQTAPSMTMTHNSDRLPTLTRSPLERT
jgi:hypothetical protein